MAAHPGDPRPHVVSQRPDPQRLRHREPETEAGTHMELPELRTRHDRNLRAAINLRNLIMPAGRSRDGPGQESLVPQQRGLPTLGAVNPGMERGRRRMRSKCGSGDHRKLIMSPRRRRNGRSNQEVPRQEPRA